MSGRARPSPEDERDQGAAAPPPPALAVAAPPLGGSAPAVVPAAVLQLAAAAWIKLERDEVLTDDEENAVVTYMELSGLWTPRQQGPAFPSLRSGEASMAAASSGAEAGSVRAASAVAKPRRSLGRRDGAPSPSEQAMGAVHAAAGAPARDGAAPGGGLSRPPSSESPDAGGRKRGAGDAGGLRRRALPDP
eukprot:15479819-Alexandrium_andersonii.AAC.1